MIVKRNRKLIVPTLAILTLSLAVSAWAQGSHGGHRDHRDALGSRFEATHDEPRLQPRHGVDPVRHWNEIAIIANALDHTPVAPGENRVFGEQLGPGRTSRAMAIVHIAIFDAVNAIAGGYQSYTGLSSARDDTSMDAAIAQAAHDTLVALFPSQRASFDARLAEDLGRIRDHREKRNGIHLGRRAAAAILALRADDGSQHAEPRVGIEYITSDEPGKWRQDPISQIPLALGAHWGEVRPFVLQSADQFRAPPPPALNSAGVRGRVRRGEAPGRRRRHHADGAQRRADHDRHLLGLRRNAEPGHAAAPVQPDRGRKSPTRWARMPSSSRGSWRL